MGTTCARYTSLSISRSVVSCLLSLKYKQLQVLNMELNIHFKVDPFDYLKVPDSKADWTFARLNLSISIAISIEVVNWIRVAAQRTCLLFPLPLPLSISPPFYEGIDRKLHFAGCQMTFSALRYDSIWPRKRCKINKFAAFWPHLAHFNCILSQKQKALANTTNFPTGTTHLHRVQCQQRVPSGREYWSARSCRWSTAQRVPRRRQQHRHPHGYPSREAPLRGSRTVGALCPPL